MGIISGALKQIADRLRDDASLDRFDSIRETVADLDDLTVKAAAAEMIEDHFQKYPPPAPEETPGNRIPVNPQVPDPIDSLKVALAVAKDMLSRDDVKVLLRELREIIQNTLTDTAPVAAKAAA